MEKEEDKSVDNITDQERDTAQSIYAEFKKKNFTSCLQQIGKLDNRVNDFKVIHNKAVIEYYKNECKKADALQKNLNAICTQFKIKADKLDDVDHCILHYNQAVMLYHQRQYTSAQRMMDKVYKFIEPMEDTLAKQVSMLAIELQLCMRQPDKAITLITYLENNILNINPTKKILTKDKKIVVPTNLDPATEKFKHDLLKYKIRCYLMNHHLNISNKELQILSKDSGNIDAMFLNANLEYLKGNYQESLRILTSIPKDCLVYRDCGESSTIMFYNNMGILHHAMGKPNLACHYFQTALKEDLAITSMARADNTEKPLYVMGGSKYHELMYNLGISLLYSNRPAQAFDCLIIAVRRYHRNSRLWLRLAECCIMVHKETNEVDFDIQQKQKELIVDIIGSKENQKIVLSSNLSNDKKYSCESQSYAVPVPSLEFASLCLKNSLLLVPSDTANSPVPLFLIPGVTPPAPPPSPGPAPSSPLSLDGVANLKNHILISSSYVALCLGDYIVALEHAKTVLDQPKISGVHKLLSHLYAAESLVLLDKITDALNHLNPKNIINVSFDLPTDDKSEEVNVKTCPPFKWCPSTITSAHAVLQYNIAVAKTIRGQLDQASVLLKQIWQQRGPTCKVPAHIIMLVIYIELQLGHADVARNLIKQYSLPHRISG